MVEIFPEWTGSVPSQVYAIVVKSPLKDRTPTGRQAYKTYVRIFTDKPSFDRHVELLQEPGMMSNAFGDQKGKILVGQVIWQELGELEPTPWGELAMKPMPYKKGRPDLGSHPDPPRQAKPKVRA